MNALINKFKGIAIYIAGFALISALVFYPELQGKKLSAHDAVTWHESTKEWKDYQDKGETIFWTNRIFSGMPLFTLAGDMSGNFFVTYYSKIMYSLPNNWGHLIAVFLCCFISLLFLHIDKRLAFVLSIAFGLNTWVLDSLWASHPTKILSLAYMFPVIAGFIGFIKLDRILGLVLIMLGLSLSIGYGHYQIVYYGVIINLALGIYFLIEAITKKEMLSFAKKASILLVAVSLAGATHLSSILVMNDYNKETMRGGKSELIKNDASGSTDKDGGLNAKYAFSWSYCWPELFNFMIPDALGGASSYHIKTNKSKLAEAVNPNEPNATMPFYWGIQPFTGAPNYLGASIMFLFIFSLFYWQSRFKFILLGIFTISMFMGLGSSFIDFNSLLFKYLPLYNKFRTPTMAFSILNIITILTIGMALKSFVSEEHDREKLVKKLKQASYVFIGLLILSFVFISSEGYTNNSFSTITFDGKTDGDNKIFGQNPQALQLILQDREALFKSDWFRALFIFIAIAAALYFHLKSQLKKQTLILIIGVIILVDLYSVYRRYLSYDVFQKVEQTADLIPNAPYNQFLEQDKSHFRMINYADGSIFNTNSDGYRFSNVGGYSPAKLYRYQDLIDVHLSRGTQPVLDMLNTKYIIMDVQGQLVPQQNPNACGNAWFVSNVKFAANANEEMDSLATFNPKATAWVDKRYQNESSFEINTDTSAKIVLTKYHPDHMEYSSNSASGGFAVFSEIWYKGNEDWKIFIDGKESKIIRTNYLLRGAFIPAGNHKVEMKFIVKKITTYKTICSILTAIMLLLCIFLVYREYKPKNIEVKA